MTNEQLNEALARAADIAFDAKLPDTDGEAHMLAIMAMWRATLYQLEPILSEV
jgi:hypothetical protein